MDEKHFDRLLDLIEIEHKAEIEQNKLELARFPIQIRESLGKSVARLTAENAGVGQGGFPLLKLSRTPEGEELAPFHAMNRGDLVCAETSTGQRLDGTLYEADEYQVLVALSGKMPEPLARGRWTLHLVGSDATFRRMKRALMDVRAAEKKPVARLRDVFSGKLKTGLEKTERIIFVNSMLNEYQKQAVHAALAARDVALVHGPPGTGKTTVLVEVIGQAVRQGLRVLASAPSNIAVDNILEKLLSSDLRVVRLGHPARTLESLRHATLAAQCADHPDAKKIRDLDLARERLMTQRSRRADRGQLGYDERHERQREVRELWRQARDLEAALSKEILQGAQVVLATHGSLSKPILKEPFDLVIMDEASQATEPLSWIPLLQAKKAVFAGDPLQLPPTLYSEEAAKQGLAVTLFERLQKSLPENLKTLLRVQYRMHEAIMEFPSKEFYGGRLIADESVRKHLLCDIRGVQKNDWTGVPLVFVDTAGAGFEEKWDELLRSRENPEEAKLAVQLLGRLLEAGIRPQGAAILTPYVAQVRRLKPLMQEVKVNGASMREAQVEVGTVDGFQGREKEAIILSLVRSNDKGEVGFLDDLRRLNVAITRARRLLVVIGDSATISRHPVYSRLIDYVQSLGAHRSTWEWTSYGENTA